MTQTTTDLMLPVFALIADYFLGDPQWPYHPVRLIGHLCAKAESFARQASPSERAAGILTVITVECVSLFCAWFILEFFHSIHYLFSYLAAIAIIWTTLAMRDMADHSNAIFQALAKGDLPAARECTARIVGRDTAFLSESELTRAAVESVAENTVDGTTAVLFFALLGAGLWGVPGAALLAVFYRAANTMDSMFGHKNKRYLHFGWAPARLDDLLNYLPARLSVIMIALAAKICGLDARGALTAAFKDGGKHESPNSGLSEAAFAGALGVRLGGENFYHGVPHAGQVICAHNPPPSPSHIKLANDLLLMTAICTAAVGVVVLQILLLRP